MPVPAGVREVLSASDRRDCARWEQLVSTAPASDVYYRPAYVRAYERAGQGRGVALVISTGQGLVLVPFLLRPLDALHFAPSEAGQDAATPYGYGGVLPLTPARAGAVPLVESLRQWCLQAGVVSCFLRLHPLLDQERTLGWETHKALGLARCCLMPTTAIPLHHWDTHNARIGGMSETRRRHLNLARRQLRLTWHSNGSAHGQALRVFEELYRQTLDRHRAESSYYFSSDYFAALVEGLGDRLGLALAWLGNQPVGAKIFLAGGTHAHYHLGAANEVGLRLHASTLLMNAGADWAMRRGAHLLHLGGGRAGADSLFHYKCSYGGPSFTYAAYGLIADERRYAALVERRRACTARPPPRDGFFPAYRG